MTKVRLSTNKAYKQPRFNTICVVFDFKNYFPTREVEVNGTAGALAALEAYSKEAEATGQSLCCYVSLMRGERSPNGFSKARTKRYVNLQPEPEEERTA
jgi:hypothetical protein